MAEHPVAPKKKLSFVDRIKKRLQFGGVSRKAAINKAVTDAQKTTKKKNGKVGLRNSKL